MKKKNTNTVYRLAALALTGLLAGSLLTGCGSRNNEIRDTPQQTDSPSQEDSSSPAAGGTFNSGESIPLSGEQVSGGVVSGGVADDLSGEGRTVTAGAEQASAGGTAGAQTAVPDYLAGSENAHFSAEGKNLLIVIDPGHAAQVPAAQEPLGPGSTEMKDADSIGTYGQASALHEYDLTMMVSRKLRTELENRGYQVLLTHYDTVQPIGCVERAEIANTNKADAFIRIHANSTTDVKANGAMTICITEDNPFHPELYSSSVRLSQILLDTYCEKTGIAREYVWKTDTMSGNNWSEVPTTMIELGYMSNPDEDLNMAQDSQQLRMAGAIADSIDLWFGLMPEEELSMHPGLTGDVPGRSSSPAPASVTSGSSENSNSGGTSSAPAQNNSGADSTSDASAVPAGTNPAAVPAGTNPAGVPAGTNPVGVPAGTSTGAETVVPENKENNTAPGTLELEESSPGEEEGTDIISEEPDQN